MYGLGNVLIAELVLVPEARRLQQRRERAGGGKVEVFESLRRGKAGREAGRQGSRQAGKQAGRQTDRQTDRQTSHRSIETKASPPSPRLSPARPFLCTSSPPSRASRGGGAAIGCRTRTSTPTRRACRPRRAGSACARQGKKKEKEANQRRKVSQQGGESTVDESGAQMESLGSVESLSDPAMGWAGLGWARLDWRLSPLSSGGFSFVNRLQFR